METQMQKPKVSWLSMKWEQLLTQLEKMEMLSGLQFQFRRWDVEKFAQMQNA